MTQVGGHGPPPADLFTKIGGGRAPRKVWCYRDQYPSEKITSKKTSLNREPLNKFDTNAIAVLHTSSRVVGHLTRIEAAKIAPHLDYTTCIWGTVAESARGYWNTSIIIDS